MKKEKFNYARYFWDLNEKALKETEDIIKNPEHGRFQPRMVKLLSRCQDPKELFSIISKEDFVRIWPKLRKYWIKIEKNSDFRDWWQTIYEQVSGDYNRKRKLEIEPSLLFQNIGKNIKEARVERGISQKDLALAAGMKQPDISRIEEGKKNITVETLARICKRLGIKNVSFKY